VFGFGKKEIEIILKKLNYSPGETINGKISLKLNKPIHARQLNVGLLGEIISTKMKKGSDGRTHPREDKRNIYNFQTSLDGEKEYSEGEYEFSIKIPENILQAIPPQEGMVGDVLKTIRFLTGSQERISWYIVINLDVPMKFDVSEKIQINIG